MLFALMVIPRSRSRSMESRTCSCISRCVSAPVISSKRSASVDLPWSMCAMMQKFRMNFGSMFLAYQFSQLRAGFERPAGFFGGPAASEQVTQRKNRAVETFSLPQFELRVSLGFNSSGAQVALREEASAARLPTVTGQTPCGPYGLIAGVTLLVGIEGGQHVLID